MMMMTKRMNTYEAWASEISLLTGQSITRQAVEERMSVETSEMAKFVLLERLSDSLQQTKSKRGKSIKSKFGINRILTEDCTNIHLPDKLSKVFPGNVSRGKKKSLAKIHALHDYEENQFLFLDIHSYTDNDQSLASKVVQYLTKGDLLLRDMGFLVLSAIRKIIKQGAYLISRKNAQCKIYDKETGHEINLVKELRAQDWFDRVVLVGQKERIEMRVIAVPLADKLAAEKRRKAKHDRDKRLNHNKEYYELLGYGIYITNIPETMCDVKDITDLYGLRWRIEIIFKSWKSCFSLEKLIPFKCSNPERIYCMIYLFLLFILLFHVKWFRCYSNVRKKDKEGLKLSLMKMAKFFLQHFQTILFLKNDKKMMEQIKSQCRYDTRKDRFNTTQKYEKLAA